MREWLLPMCLVSALNLRAQFPPIDLEWSALRAYDENGDSRISRDPVNGTYAWSVNDPEFGVEDEHIYPFQADGTDIAPSYPPSFNVGSLDHMVDMTQYDGALHSIMHHQTLGGSPQDILWHLDGVSIQSPDPYLEDSGHDLLVTEDGVWGCGRSMTSYVPYAAVCRVIKLDLSGVLAWNITWDGAPIGVGNFSSMAVIGDTLICAAFPYLVLFNATTGAFIDAFDPHEQDPPLQGDAQLIAHGQRIYWVKRGTVDEILFGWYDLPTGDEMVLGTNLTGNIGTPRIAIDIYDHVWISSTAAGEGHWFRMNADLDPIDNGTLYGSITDMVIVNDRISLTGSLGYGSGTTYVVTGTPQP